MVVVEGNHTPGALEEVCQVGCDRQGSPEKARTSLSISAQFYIVAWDEVLPRRIQSYLA
jgi:hypothetical protein